MATKPQSHTKSYPLCRRIKGYVEPFFGGGGMFFNKPKAPINHLNDLDDDITNLYFVLKNNAHELIEYLERVPYSNSFWQYVRKATPENKVEKAAFFAIKSNWGFMGMSASLRIGDMHNKKSTLQNLEEMYILIANEETTTIQNNDFRQFLKNITQTSPDNWFVYADKPYTGTDSNYKPDAWTLQDDADLVDCLLAKGGKFMISEYDGSPFEPIAEAANLQKILIKKKTFGLGHKRQEVVWVNYSPAFQKSIFV